MATRAVLLDRTRIPGSSGDLLQPFRRRACTTSHLGDDPAADAPSRTADGLGHVIVGTLVNDDREPSSSRSAGISPPETGTRVVKNSALAVPSAAA